MIYGDTAIIGAEELKRLYDVYLHACQESWDPKKVHLGPHEWAENIVRGTIKLIVEEGMGKFQIGDRVRLKLAGNVVTPGLATQDGEVIINSASIVKIDDFEGLEPDPTRFNVENFTRLAELVQVRWHHPTEGYVICEGWHSPEQLEVKDAAKGLPEYITKAHDKIRADEQEAAQSPYTPVEPSPRLYKLWRVLTLGKESRREFMEHPEQFTPYYLRLDNEGNARLNTQVEAYFQKRGKLPRNVTRWNDPAPSAASLRPTPKVEEEMLDPIPAFDPSVVNGIYKKFVDVATRGTSMAPQFVYAIAKTVVGARMAGKVRFENLDVEPRFYTALIGETGSGKGEAWRRVFQILNVESQIGNIAGLKIINSADSGAGIRDAFFEPPESAPMLMYIDEVESFGNKAAATRNPAIMDMLIELADSTQISSVKASRGKAKGMKTKNDARLCAVMCGQEGSVYMKAFAGRTKLGLWDRLTPEYSVAVEAGDLPHISTADAFQLLSELNKLDYSGVMTMSSDGKMHLETFWSAQPAEVRKKARWKKNLTLDAYMSAFGRGSKVAELEDVEIAIRIFTRQLVIRQTHFTTEVPDRVGYYLGLIKAVTGRMQRQLAAGIHPSQVAKSRRDYEKETNAHRDNETHIFERAWSVHAPTWLTKVNVKKDNGQIYTKFLPVDDD